MRRWRVFCKHVLPPNGDEFATGKPVATTHSRSARFAANFEPIVNPLNKLSKSWTESSTSHDTVFAGSMSSEARTAATDCFRAKLFDALNVESKLSGTQNQRKPSNR